MRLLGNLPNMDRNANVFRMPYRQVRQYNNAAAPSVALNPDQLVGQPSLQIPPHHTPYYTAYAPAPPQNSASGRCVGKRDFYSVNPADRMSSFAQTKRYKASPSPGGFPYPPAQNMMNMPFMNFNNFRMPGVAPSPNPGAGRNTRSSEKAKALANAPKPDADYMQQAHNTPYAMGKQQKLLIILDLNGTLLVRPTRKKRGNFVKRPFVDEFISTCLKHHKVMIWSSAQPESVNHMVQGLAGESERASFVATWNRQQLRLNPAAYSEKVQVYKHLTWVWDDETVQASHPDAEAGTFWDQTNTVLIDDSYLKASSEPYNHIEVPEFSEDLLVREQAHPVLHELLRYIEEASHFEDVSAFIRKNPFRMPDQP